MISSHKIRGKKIEYYISYAGRGAETVWLGRAARLGRSRRQREYRIFVHDLVIGRNAKQGRVGFGRIEVFN